MRKRSVSTRRRRREKVPGFRRVSGHAIASQAWPSAGTLQGGIGSLGSVDGLRHADRGSRTGGFLSQAGQASVGMPG